MEKIAVVYFLNFSTRQSLLIFTLFFHRLKLMNSSILILVCIVI